MTRLQQDSHAEVGHEFQTGKEASVHFKTQGNSLNKPLNMKPDIIPALNLGDTALCVQGMPHPGCELNQAAAMKYTE